MADIAIREGFLCPICMQDLGSVTDLQHHFEQAHSGEDKDVINQLKGLFGKAKRLLKKDKESDDVFAAFSGEGTAPVPDNVVANASGIDPAMWEPQEIGASRSYTDGFKQLRDARIDRFVVETNKLLIRLDKLVSLDAPSEPNKRKAFEKGVVPWAPDADVHLCTSCGKSFTLTRRRHHCRLCGGIICNRCSQFLPFSYAKKLTNPAFNYEGEGFRRSSSSTSLNSILSPEGEPNIRTCQECRILLERRDQQIEQRNRKPFIVQIYEKMRAYIEETEQLMPKFLEMIESLMSGETTYNLREAQVYRGKLLKLYDNIDLLSKRIYTLGSGEPEPPTPGMLRLQKMIRLQASGFLQHNMMGLQALPTEEQLLKLQEQKQREAQQRIEEERRLTAEREKRRKDEQRKQEQIEAQRRVKATPSKNQNDTKEKKLPSPQGWKPQEIRTGNCDDPMIQQMNIIRGYVKQAKQVGKWDEVQMLEENLRDLQKEYWKQQELEKRLASQKLEQKQNVNSINNQSNKNSFDDSKNPFSQHSSGHSSPSQTSPSKSRTSPSKARTPPSPLSRNNLNPFEEDDSTNPFTAASTNPFSEVGSPKNPFTGESLNS